MDGCIIKASKEKIIEIDEKIANYATFPFQL